MAGPRNSLPSNLRLKLNNNTGFYEDQEEGITYQLTFAQMNALKLYFKCNHLSLPTYQAWYNSLNRFEKKEIKRLNIPPGDDQFYADPEFEH